jgi:hypothetical protein
MTTLKRHEIKHCFQNYVVGSGFFFLGGGAWKSPAQLVTFSNETQSGVWVNELISKFKTKQVFSYKLPEESFDWV